MCRQLLVAADIVAAGVLWLLPAPLPVRYPGPPLACWCVLLAVCRLGRTLVLLSRMIAAAEAHVADDAPAAAVANDAADVHIAGMFVGRKAKHTHLCQRVVQGLHWHVGACQVHHGLHTKLRGEQRCGSSNGEIDEQAVVNACILHTVNTCCRTSHN